MMHSNNNKYSAIDIDSKFLNGKTRVLFADNDAIIISLNNKPYALFASKNFNFIDIPIDITKEIKDITKIMFKSSLTNNKCEMVSIKSLLEYFPKVDYLALEHVEVKALDIPKQNSLAYLILNDVSFKNRNKILNEFSELNKLKYLVYDKSLTSLEVHIIKGELPNLNAITESDFLQQIQNGKIQLN